MWLFVLGIKLYDIVEYVNPDEELKSPPPPLSHSVFLQALSYLNVKEKTKIFEKFFQQT